MTNQPNQPSTPAPRIALLTCRHHDHIDHASEGKLMQELVRQGAVVTLVAWTDMIDLVASDSGEEIRYTTPTQSGHDALVLRTTWDYWDRLDEFRAFLKGCLVEDESQLLNSAKTALANLDKTYLAQLEAAGVPIVPTIFVTRGSEPDAIARAKSNNWSPLIIKPTIAAAAVGLKKFDRPDTAAAEYLGELTKTGGALVQPYLPRITTEGETSLVYFDSVFSHAVTKLPAPGDFRSQTDFGGVYTLVQPTEAQLHVAQLALAAWESKYGDTPLYARVDLVPGHDGEPLLGELELIEPELFLDMADHAAQMFATAILNRAAQRESPAGGSRLWTLAGFAVLFACLGVFGLGIGVVFGWIRNWIFGGP